MRLFLIAALASATSALAEGPAPDFANDSAWLCRPGRSDACAVPIAVTAVAANGTTRPDALPTPKMAPQIDCFYVYPTVSTDQTPNSDLVIDAAERNVARVQFAQMRQVCRPYAPMYRQVTLKGLRDAMTGQATTADRAMAYQDVAAAFAHYMKHDNQGRGVILYGHSQGSGVLKALIANEIEGKPAAAQVIAAWLPGTNVLVPEGKPVGGDFKVMPLCTAADQAGCILSWVTFRNTATPPASARFARTSQPGMKVACTNPAALRGGKAMMRAILPAGPSIVDNSTPVPVWASGASVTTPFVSLPGLLTGECIDEGGAQRLSIITNADSADPRTDEIGGDVIVAGQVQADWGLHLIDVNVALGDLLALAPAQAAAWSKLRQAAQ
ncbi:hypothetical protein FHS79_000214 [Polymorphobacter multimanifer]|uniref:DUF3089 domain-containing protein n=1 Tax=Polymorphobacter multimanifer TaxID=1070431 RepID=A0A841L514_9SPHN|nr:DUF3089 domain-containing protein [Polymorphobacter multimanifer]MBB6226063.1 hypothetical protein [Polymorphobacter multimanifer]